MHIKRQNQAVQSLAIGSILVSHIFIFIPFTLYVGNIDDFTMPFVSILKVYSWPIVLLVIFLALIGAFVKANRFPGYLSFLATIGLLVWIQANLLVWNYGLLNGDSIDWGEGAWRGWLDGGIWSALMLLVLLSNDRIGKVVVRIGVAVFCLQGWLILVLAYLNTAALSEKASITDRTSEVGANYSFSSQNNVIHIVADGFQSDIFEEILKRDSSGTFAGALEGFVFFREHMGVFQLTHMSIPAILSGKVYRNDLPRQEFLDEAIGGRTIVNEAFRAGYEIDLAVPASLWHLYARSQHTNAYLLPDSLHVSERRHELQEAIKLFDLALFRSVPHVLKQYIYNEQLWFAQALLIEEKAGQAFFSHTAFLRDMVKNMSIGRQTPVYKYVHLMLSHRPMVTTPDCEYAGGVLPANRANVMSQARCALIEVVRLLERMRELNIYKNATIVLQADHGAWVPANGLELTADAGDGERIVFHPAYVGHALPLMAIKVPGASGPIRTSLAYSSIVDTPATIASVIGLDVDFDGRSILDLDAGEARERRHYIYEYDRNEWRAEYLAPIQEYVVSGSAYDEAAWRKGNEYFPKGVVEVVGQRGP
jgi:hypothetical protein